MKDSVKIVLFTEFVNEIFTTDTLHVAGKHFETTSFIFEFTFLNNVVVIKTKIILPQAKATLAEFSYTV